MDDVCAGVRELVLGEGDEEVVVVVAIFEGPVKGFYEVLFVVGYEEGGSRKAHGT